MPHHEEKQCERCDASFECKVGNIANCDCSQVPVTGEVSAYLGEKFQDCVCVGCLRQIAEQFREGRQESPECRDPQEKAAPEK